MGYEELLERMVNQGSNFEGVFNADQIKQLAQIRKSSNPAPTGISPGQGVPNFAMSDTADYTLNVSRDTINAGASSELGFIFGYPQGTASNYKILNDLGITKNLASGYSFLSCLVGDRAGLVTDDAYNVRFNYGNGTADDTVEIGAGGGLEYTEFLQRINGSASFSVGGYDLDCSELSSADAAKVFRLKPVAFQKTPEGGFTKIPLQVQSINPYQQQTNTISIRFAKPVNINTQTGLAWAVPAVASLNYQIRLYFDQRYNF